MIPVKDIRVLKGYKVKTKMKKELDLLTEKFKKIETDDTYIPYVLGRLDENKTESEIEPLLSELKKIMLEIHGKDRLEEVIGSPDKDMEDFGENFKQILKLLNGFMDVTINLNKTLEKRERKLKERESFDKELDSIKDHYEMDDFANLCYLTLKGDIDEDVIKTVMALIENRLPDDLKSNDILVVFENYLKYIKEVEYKSYKEETERRASLENTQLISPLLQPLPPFEVNNGGGNNNSSDVLDFVTGAIALAGVACVGFQLYKTFKDDSMSDMFDIGSSFDLGTSLSTDNWFNF